MYGRQQTLYPGALRKPLLLCLLIIFTHRDAFQYSACIGFESMSFPNGKAHVSNCYLMTNWHEWDVMTENHV